jgi:hypothetical protein
MRAWIPVALALPFSLVGCPALLGDWAIDNSGATDAATDATGLDAAGRRPSIGSVASSGSRGGSRSGGSTNSGDSSLMDAGSSSSGGALGSSGGSSGLASGGSPGSGGTTGSSGGSSSSGGGVVCATMAPAAAACTGGPPNYTKPAYYFSNGALSCNNQGSANCYPKATPAACQCAQTYNCGCILPLESCSADSGVSCKCDDSTGTVVITCWSCGIVGWPCCDGTCSGGACVGGNCQ